jgi:hypothetical protein
MELGFVRNSGLESAGRSSAGLDFGVLTAALRTFQAASATARAHAGPDAGGKPAKGSNGSLVELLIAGPQWQQALEEQGGCFNRSCARRR